MSINLPRRAVRIPILQRQCLFQRRQNLSYRSPISASTSRAFSSTPTRCRKPRANNRNMTRVAAESSVTQAPKVNMQEAQRDATAMAEDIGLLQDTTVRAPFSKLPGPWRAAFWSYFWAVVKSKATGLYSRSTYKRMRHFSRGFWSYFPMDAGNNLQLKTYAKKYYEQVYQAFAKGDLKTIQRFCLPPLAKDFEQRLLARPEGLEMKWTFNEKSCSATVVSHRASMLGEENPNTAYRQAVIRLKSVQSLEMKANITKIKREERKGGSKPDVPAERSQQQTSVEQNQPSAHEYLDNGVEKTVVEYIVLQKRLINGKEEDDWKVQGFTEESTPETMEEDAAYWRRTVNAQANQLV